MSAIAAILKLLRIPFLSIDEGGNIKEYAKDTLGFLYHHDILNSIFQVDPTMNLVSWKENYNKVKRLGNQKITSSYLGANNIIEQTEIFQIHEDDMIIYLFLGKHLSAANSLSTEVPIVDNKKNYGDWNFDHDGPVGVLYVDQDGICFQENTAFTELYGVSVLDGNINDIFLETEIGKLPNAIDHQINDHEQLVIRMICKSKNGLKVGYTRCTKHSPEGDRFYRIEFVPNDDMLLIDEDLEKAIAQLDRERNKTKQNQKDIIEHTRPTFSFDEIITTSEKYIRVLENVAQVADTDTTVLISGETGSGKELLANAIYRLSDRNDKPFVKINCAAIPESLVESVLFGHEKGAFTGADKKQIGKFELAHNGTIFLDEIGELSLDIQSKFLRVLQENEIERIGNPEAFKVDVRVIAATNRNLKTEVDKGHFRSDLFYRLNIFPIHSIPLRERKEDIPALADHFIKLYCKNTGKNELVIKSRELKMLTAYDFPGNVRELENIIHRAVILSKGEFLELRSSLLALYADQSESTEFSTLDGVIIKHISNALKMTNGKVSGAGSASELLGINHKTLSSKIKKYGINLDQLK